MSGKVSDQFAVAVTDLLAPLGPIRRSRFFSSIGLTAGTTQFAMIMRGRLYFRVDGPLAQELAKRGEPFAYDTKARRVTVAAYYTVPDDWLDDGDTLLIWARRAIDVAAKRKRPRRSVSR